MATDGKIDPGAGDPNRFNRWARAHPASFSALLVVLTATVTVALLFQKGYSFVLYQGF